MIDTPEKYFLKFAYPAAKFCGIDKDKVRALESLLLIGGAPTKQEIEELFPIAMERIKKSTGNPDSWDLDVMKNYWLSYHNKIIENKACHIYLAEVIEIYPTENRIKQVKLRLNKREFFSKSYEPLSKGDKVACHFNQITTKLSKEDINKYFKK